MHRGLSYSVRDIAVDDKEDWGYHEELVGTDYRVYARATQR